MQLKNSTKQIGGPEEVGRSEHLKLRTNSCYLWILKLFDRKLKLFQPTSKKGGGSQLVGIFFFTFI